MPDLQPDPSLRGVLSLLAEKMGLTPAEFAASTVVIEGGNASIMPKQGEPVDTKGAK